MTTWQPPPLTETRYVVLTKRESQILSGMACGLSNSEIGAGLYVTEDTVKSHARKVLLKLRCRNRAHAVALAVSGQVHITVKDTLRSVG